MTETIAEPAVDPTASVDALRARIRQLEERVRRAVAARREGDPDPDDKFRGLYISERHADELLERERHSLTSQADVAMLSSRPIAEEDGGRSRLERLCREFGLDALDIELLVIAIAPDIDPRFERLYAYLQDDVTRRRPSIGLGLELCGLSTWSGGARDRLAPRAPLIDSGLLRIDDDDRPLLTRPLRSPDRIVAHLLGSDRVDSGIAELVAPVSGARLSATSDLSAALDRGVKLIYFRDRVGSAAASVGVSALAELGRPALTLDLERMDTGADGLELMRIAVREARLTRSGIVAGPIDELTKRAPSAIEALADADLPVMLSGHIAWESRWSRRVPWITDAPLATVEDRRGLWAREPAFGRVDAVLTSMDGFRLGPEQTERPSRSAIVRAIAGDREPVIEDLHAGARAENASGLDRLSRRVEPRASWSDLVLPDSVAVQLHDLASRARHRDIVLDQWGLGGGASHGRGVTALFAGDPGTGKTMSAEVVASELGLDLYVIDLSSVVDKYIGETEKNLDRIFSQADRINGVLLFDEADALFGQRSEVSDARDRYANVEIAYLLQRMEQFDGLAILTTNLRANVDEAFLRRLDALVDFPMPEVEDRLAIWRLHLPDRVPRASDVDLDFMAQRFKLAGGHIRNICLTAAFYAAEHELVISMDHLIRATEREYTKLGRLTVEAEFGHYLGATRPFDRSRPAASEDAA